MDESLSLFLSLCNSRILLPLHRRVDRSPRGFDRSAFSIIKEHRLNVVARSVDSCWGGGEGDWSEYCSLLMRKETAKKRLGARRFNAFSREKGGRVAAHSSRDFASTDACPAQTFFDEPRRVSARTEPRLASPEYSLLSTHTHIIHVHVHRYVLCLFFFFFFFIYIYIYTHTIRRKRKRGERTRTLARGARGAHTRVE